jgi:hypothetical protein
VADGLGGLATGFSLADTDVALGLGALVSFRPGDHILFRSVKDGRVHGALPVTVVNDEADLSVLYLAEGTPIKWPALPDGGDPRSIPPEDAFRAGWSTIDRNWTGHGILMVTDPGAAHSVWHFWRDPNRTFWGWYVNRHAPLRRTPLGSDSDDHTLAIWVEQPRAWEWKDEQELAAAVKVGYYSADQAAAIRAEGKRVVERIERWDSPFRDGWERWEPDPAWPLPELPAEWGRL